MNIVTLNQIGAFCFTVGLFCVATIKFDLRPEIRSDPEQMRAFRKIAIPAPENLTALGIAKVALAKVSLIVLAVTVVLIVYSSLTDSTA